jgi:predicted acyltransferase (DUF342 family)
VREERTLYYLVANINGFEELVRLGEAPELERLLRKLEQAEKTSGPAVEPWALTRHYLVSKEDWERDYCPFIPVDLS